MQSFFLLPIFLFFIAAPLFANPSWEPIKAKVLKADINPRDRKEKTSLVKEAIQLADQCITENPAEAPCYYYRAQATGLYYEVMVFGYQKGIRHMIQDWQKSAELDPQFDHAGPYRMLGELYTDLPKYFGTKDVRQDLNKALMYLKKAAALDPNYPTQQIDMAEVFIKNKNKNEAAEALKKAEELLPQWTQDPYYPGWQTTMRELQKRIVKLERYKK